MTLFSDEEDDSDATISEEPDLSEDLVSEEDLEWPKDLGLEQPLDPPKDTVSEQPDPSVDLDSGPPESFRQSGGGHITT